MELYYTEFLSKDDSLKVKSQKQKWQQLVNGLF